MQVWARASSYPCIRVSSSSRALRNRPADNLHAEHGFVTAARARLGYPRRVITSVRCVVRVITASLRGGSHYHRLRLGVLV